MWLLGLSVTCLKVVLNTDQCKQIETAKVNNKIKQSSPLQINFTNVKSHKILTSKYKNFN